MKHSLPIALLMVALSTGIHAKVSKSIEHNSCDVGLIDVRYGSYDRSAFDSIESQREKMINVIESKGYKVDAKFRNDFIKGQKISSEISNDPDHKRLDLMFGLDLGGRSRTERSSDDSFLTKAWGAVEDASNYVVETFENILSEKYAVVSARGVKNTTQRISKKIYPTLVNPGNDEDIVEEKKEVKESIKELKEEIAHVEDVLALELKLQKEFQKSEPNVKKISRLNDKLAKLDATTFEIEGLEADDTKEVVVDLDDSIKDHSISLFGLKSELQSNSIEMATYNALDRYFIAWEEKHEDMELTSDFRIIFRDSKSFRRKSLAKDPQMLIDAAEMLPICVVNADVDLDQKVVKTKTFNPFGRKFKAE